MAKSSDVRPFKIIAAERSDPGVWAPGEAGVINLANSFGSLRKKELSTRNRIFSTAINKSPLGEQNVSWCMRERGLSSVDVLAKTWLERYEEEINLKQDVSCWGTSKWVLFLHSDGKEITLQSKRKTP